MTRALAAAAALVLAALSGCAGSALGPDPAADPESVFEAAWSDFDRYYAFFAHNAVDWDAARARYRPRVAAGTGTAELRAVLCALVAEARSFHASLHFPGGSCTRPGIDPRPGYVAGVVARYVPRLERTPSGKIQYGALGNDLVYARIPDFEGSGWGGEIGEVLEAHPAARGVVIDLRGNGGGNESVGKEIAGRFLDREQVYRVSRYRNGPGRDDFTGPVEYRLSPRGERSTLPLAVLTDRRNGSAAEDFLMMVRVLPDAVTVGDTTIGNSSNPLTRELPNGWVLRIPQSVQSTPEGYVVEGRGLPPDLPVRFAAADSARGVDPVLEAAMAALRRR